MDSIPLPGGNGAVCREGKFLLYTARLAGGGQCDSLSPAKPAGRGVAVPRLIAASGSLWPGLLLTAAGFGLQHLVFSVTIPSALAYAHGFI